MAPHYVNSPYLSLSVSPSQPKPPVVFYHPRAPYLTNRLCNTPKLNTNLAVPNKHPLNARYSRVSTNKINSPPSWHSPWWQRCPGRDLGGPLSLQLHDPAKCRGTLYRNHQHRSLLLVRVLWSRSGWDGDRPRGGWTGILGRCSWRNLRGRSPPEKWKWFCSKWMVLEFFGYHPLFSVFDVLLFG